MLLNMCWPPAKKEMNVRKIAIAFSAVAALATTAAVTPAEARGGRNAAIGFGVPAGVLGAAAVANGAYGPGYGYGPRYGYYGGGPYAYYDRPYYGPRRGWRHRHYHGW